VTIWAVPAGLAVALLACWLTLVAALLLARPKASLLAETVRILPDLLRLLRRLVTDPTLPRGVRIRLGLLLAYLAFPIDLIPDLIPVVGYADDAILTVVVLRSVVRRAGIEPVRRHWPGSQDGLTALQRLTGIKDTPAGPTKPSGPGDARYPRDGATRSGT
jgi:uncharacterized membrane protein YkvA (DUF1232 family)